MTFEEMKKIVVDTLSRDEDKVTMEASLTGSGGRQPGRCGAEHGTGRGLRSVHPR